MNFLQWQQKNWADDKKNMPIWFPVNGTLIKNVLNRNGSILGDMMPMKHISLLVKDLLVKTYDLLRIAPQEAPMMRTPRNPNDIPPPSHTETGA